MTSRLRSRLQPARLDNEYTVVFVIQFLIFRETILQIFFSDEKAILVFSYICRANGNSAGRKATNQRPIVSAGAYAGVYDFGGLNFNPCRIEYLVTGALNID
jgi:hypothetical protein